MLMHLPARLALLLVACAVFLPATLVQAHSFTVGEIKIDHPYAPPTPGGVKNGAVYFRAIENSGKKPDRLLSARAQVAERVELHRMQMDGAVMRMREVEAILLPTGPGPSFRHGQSDAYHLMLINLKAPLKEGDRFPVWLRFENAGEKEVTVWVQKPKGASSDHHHKH
jgi:copper(I)-binding protein